MGPLGRLQQHTGRGGCLRGTSASLGLLDHVTGCDPLVTPASCRLAKLARQREDGDRVVQRTSTDTNYYSSPQGRQPAHGDGRRAVGDPDRQRDHAREREEQTDPDHAWAYLTASCCSRSILHRRPPSCVLLLLLPGPAPIHAAAHVY